MKKCQKCGALLQDDVIFCTACGEDMRQLIPPNRNQQQFCPNCGNHVNTNMKFCDGCGYNLDTVKADQNVTKSESMHRYVKTEHYDNANRITYTDRPANANRYTNRDQLSDAEQFTRTEQSTREKQPKRGVSPKIIGLFAGLGMLVVLSIVIVIVVISKGKKEEHTIEYPAVNVDSVVSETMPFTTYDFEDIVIGLGSKYTSPGRVSFLSEEENYYGEITVGERCYVDGSTGEFEGTYSLFVVESGSSTTITVKSVMNAYYRTDSMTGKAVGNEVEYPGDADWFWGRLSRCTDGFEVEESISGLSVVRGLLGDNETFPSESYILKACVISQAEAIRYAEDGTLPACLKGLTVSGLDLIFRKP